MTADELVQDIERLTALPEICIQVNRMIDSPNYSAFHISKIISQDVDLSARLLRIVNSAFYGMPGRIETISRAITIVGTAELRNLVMMTSASQLFRNIPGQLMDVVEFWRFSVYTGMVAGALAKRCRVLHPERLFVQGVLHDIGRLPIYLRLPEKARDILFITKGDDDLLCAAEESVLGFTHCEVGEALTRRWQLPESIQIVARHHHEPHRASECLIETALVHIGSVLADGGSRMELLEQSVERIHPFAWKITGLRMEDLERIENDVYRQVSELVRLVLPVSA